jgi:uncharacterized protein YcbK (DUF882 family)
MLLLRDDKRFLSQGISRRGFLGMGVLALLSGVVPRLCFASLIAPHSSKRSLSFFNTHTGESLSTIYWGKGKYLPSALKDINYILRDHRCGDIKPISTQLLDLLYVIQVKLGTQRAFHIISGYRSPKTNALLCMNSKGVAKNSFHMSGKAVDLRLPACPLSVLRKVAMGLKAGGVGYYPRSNFVHIDVGSVRFW